MKTIDEIVKEYNLSETEKQGLEKMFSMIFCLRKYIRLNELLNKNK